VLGAREYATAAPAMVESRANPGKGSFVGDLLAMGDAVIEIDV
jgi:hypothetical protein